MTDERIREEFEAWQPVMVNDSEKAFYKDYSIDMHEIACGFYAGFKTAEKLAKIEVLNELFAWVDNEIDACEHFNARTDLFIEFSRRIKELKEGK